jgi:hypothetical protein
MRRTTVAVIDSILLFWALGLGPLCWILRDGLGPNSVDSHGTDAVARFCLTFYWGPTLLALVALRLLLGRGTRRRAGTPDA